MSWKSFGFAVLSHLLLLAVGFFIGRMTAPEPLPPEIGEAKRDTVYLPYAGEIPKAEIKYIKIPAEEAKPGIFNIKIDTTFVMAGDSIDLQQTVAFDESRKTFDVMFDLAIRKADQMVVVDSIPYLVEVPIPVEQPFYNSFLAGVIATILTALAFLIFI